MNRILLILCLGLLACNSGKENTKTTAADDQGNTFIVYDYERLKPLINKEDDKVHVVNFWATWCAPCVKELPYFETINEKYDNDKVEVILVSLDFPKHYETKLRPFIKAQDLKSEVVALDDVDQNMWIPDINENWSGAIPATIIYNKDKRKFYEGSFTYEELENEIKQFL